MILNHSGLFDETLPLFTLTIDKSVPVFMILSGFVFAISGQNKQFSDHYKFSLLKKKFFRFTIPMVVAFGLYQIYNWITGNPQSLFEAFKAFVLGEFGQGAYYYNLMLEFVFIGPVIYYVIKRLDVNGVILIGLVNLIYEILCSAYGLHTALYRVIIFRYLLAFALGMFYGKNIERKIPPEALIKMIVIGVLYILLPNVWGYSYKIFTYSPWGSTSMFSVLYVFPIVYILLDAFNDYKSRTCIGRLAERVGRASYHIMYTQMFYYVVRPTFDRAVFNLSAIGYVELIIDILLPTVAGIVYERITSCVLSNMKM